MGDYVEDFTIDGDFVDVYELSRRYWEGLGYTLREAEDSSLLAFEKGRLRRNILTFSLEEAHKLLIISFVKGQGGSRDHLACMVLRPLAGSRKE